MSNVDQQPINRVPAALLRFLGISGAEGPDRLLSYVQGTTDLLPWWILSQEQEALFSAAPPAATTGWFPCSAEVPAGQRWLVSQFSIRVTPGAASSAAGVGAVRNEGGGLPFAIGTPTLFLANPADSLVDCMGPRPRFLLLQPRDKIGVWITQSTGAAAHSVIAYYKFSTFTA